MSIKLFSTEDGSYTLYDETLDVHYRSTQGAITESRHVFLDGTGISSQPAPWSILELGFGGAINFLLTAQTFLQTQTQGTLAYHTFDYAAVDPNLLAEDTYATWLEEKELFAMAKRALSIAQDKPNKPIHETHTFGERHIELTFYTTSWQDQDAPAIEANAIYHDPFGPKANPQSWTKECFVWLQRAAAPTARLATYGAASHARRAMIDAGWQIAKAPGAGRKREMTIAALQPEQLDGYKIIPPERYKT